MEITKCCGMPVVLDLLKRSTRKSYSVTQSHAAPSHYTGRCSQLSLSLISQYFLVFVETEAVLFLSPPLYLYNPIESFVKQTFRSSASVLDRCVRWERKNRHARKHVMKGRFGRKQIDDEPGFDLLP